MIVKRMRNSLTKQRIHGKYPPPSTQNNDLERRRSVRSFPFILLTIYVTLCAGTAQAQTSGFVSIQSRANLDQASHKVFFDAGINRSFNERLGVSSYALVMDSYGELYLGPTYAPSKKLRFGLGAGGEQLNGSLVPRGAVSALVASGKFFAIGIVEFNDRNVFQADDTSFFYVAQATYRLTKPLTLGLRLRRPDGFGPQITWKMGPAQTWVAWTPFLPEDVEWRPGRLISGIQLNL